MRSEEGRRRWWQGRRSLRGGVHVLFWTVVVVFYVAYFGRSAGAYGRTLLFVGLLLPVTVATTYIFLYVLIPRYLLRRRYVRFALYSAYTLVGSVYLELVVVALVFIFVADYELGAMDPASRNVLDLAVGMYLVVFVAVAANLVERWYAVQAARERLERARLEAELKLKEAELERLKAQIQPHFLFNMLNTLYALTLEQSEAAPDMVLRLSAMLDYVLYRGAAPRVVLDAEIEYLEHYVALERLRYGDRVAVSFSTSGPTASTLVAPLLVLPFVENAFKHGVGRAPGAAWIRLDLAVEDGVLRARVANSKGPEPDAETTGIGLANVRQRLDLLYPGAYTLRIDDDGDAFRVDLELRLDGFHPPAVP